MEQKLRILASEAEALAEKFQRRLKEDAYDEQYYDKFKSIFTMFIDDMYKNMALACKED